MVMKIALIMMKYPNQNMRNKMSNNKIDIGFDYWDQSQKKIIQWDEEKVSNYHIGVFGTSGSGKTHWIRKFIHGLSSNNSNIEFDILDYHGDIEIEDAKSVLFSESTRYGFNPLVLNTDPHYGGVRRTINDLLESMNDTARKLGTSQEGVLRNLLIDTYMYRGIFADNPRSWNKRNVSESELKSYIEKRDWNSVRECYPTLNDVVTLGTRKLKALWLGIEDKENGRKALLAFEDFCRTASQVTSLRTKSSRTANKDDIDKLEAKLEKSKSQAIEYYSEFINKVENGREFDELIKYNSKDVLLGVINRLENLIALGIFNPNPPPFGESKKRRYILKPLASSEDELKMFVYQILKRIIREERQKGEYDGLRRLIVLDESKKFNTESPSNPINIIANEMRKFGLGILLAGQSPSHVSNDFIINAGTILLLNLSTADWDNAARKLKIDPKMMKYFKPQQTGAVRLMEKGQQPAFKQISFS